MGKKYTKDDFRKKGVAEKVAKKSGLKVVSGKGSHSKIYSPYGKEHITIVRGRDIGRGLASKIFKKFVEWGIILGILIALIAYLWR
jgi:predicted RNA binding protein YcfA (HicA-like mRNA interferase family)